MHRLPSDIYRFRKVLENVLQTPCCFVWLLVLVFHVQRFWLALILAFVLGVTCAHLLAWLVFLLGHAAIAGVDRWQSRRGGDDS